MSQLIPKALSSALLAAALSLSYFANAEPVDLNQADAETLADNIVGVGPVLAKAIVPAGMIDAECCGYGADRYCRRHAVRLWQRPCFCAASGGAFATVAFRVHDCRLLPVRSGDG